MKTLSRILTVASVLFVTASLTFAHDTPEIKSSAALEKMKKLVGTWKGTGADMGDGKVEVQYHLSSGGSAVVETLFPGTPHEMTSVYYDEGGKLAMTHYCMVGNHPTMELKKETGSELVLETNAKSHHDLAKEPHMNSLGLTFVGPNSIEHRWSSVEPGKEGHTSTFKLERVL